MCIRDRLLTINTVTAIGDSSVTTIMLSPETDKLHFTTRRYSPVSYTHLDVYKRQEMYGSAEDLKSAQDLNYLPGRISKSAAWGMLARVYTVSYTHLSISLIVWQV